MACKRLMLDDEEQDDGFSFDLENQENIPTNNMAKRRKGLLETPLQRMLKRHIPANSATALSPITELSYNMRGARLNECASGTPKSTNTLRTFNSINSIASSYDSGNSLDDEYLHMFELDQRDAVGHDLPVGLPDDLEQLITGQLKTDHISESSSEPKARSARRCLSMLPSDPAEEDSNGSSVSVLSHKTSPSATRMLLRKSVSMNDADILTALGDEPELIGDLSKPCALPCLIAGTRHRDLKTISCDTLARLINGDFGEQLGNDCYQIIDCRYPYEYEGGHIRGAQNLYTRALIKEAFPAAALKPVPGQRYIYIFHCEFSSERGPKLLRFLRSNDRSQHTHNYPALDYPELYLLHNGYKEFFNLHANLCEPRGYVPMLAPAYNEEFRHFRAKTKSWQCGDGDGADSGIGGGGSTGSRTLRKSRSRLLYAE
ncbi:GL25772 [Drosophila persimilis]|uniref:protein-tyrosine-phosphatase n=1 Tax=Drosophila persimilis TaxID=7234 RepID=B4GK04_DROPE|nr:cdc25-like protein phosphatase twine [Drosophila persimilis]XP_026843372.1 cdc25-like protein phosphatase twine [Drosophila persimilis]XP_026843373.1 cdc25-like protein phosphatase twine [Drosophila persimilis]EDW36970.1 GL25772 [Drosophila persimilis]